MDVNADGFVDLLSGSYSRQDPDMAGLFQVLPGLEGGGFGPAEPLLGSDGEPLIIDSGENVVGKICTRPTAVDLDGDGHLDIVSGNFEGSFYLFRGTGDGAFSPASEQLTLGGEPLKVPHHSDPVFFDWDGDGDLDLVSGSVKGVHLFERTADGEFAEPVDLLEIEPADSFGDDVVFGEDHITAPQGSLRIWIDDVNGDGRFDLLIGDNAQVTTPVEGLDEATARERLAQWQRGQDELMKRVTEAGGEWSDELSEEYQAHWEARAEIVDSGGTGFVWVMHQLAPSSS